MQYEILHELKDIRQIVDAMYQDKIDQAKRMQESCKAGGMENENHNDLRIGMP